MNAPARIFVLLLTLVFATPARADQEGDKQADLAQMKKIWEAFHAYKKDFGTPPKQLVDLVPKYLPDRKLLLSPLEADAPPGTALRGGVDSSYVYEFRENPGSARETRARQMEEYGGIVPVLRSFAREPTILNISYDGDVFESQALWETSPAVKDLLEKRGLAPGLEGRKLRVVVRGPDDQPLEGVEVRATLRRFRNAPLPDRSIITGPDGVGLLPIGEVPGAMARLGFSKEGYAAPEQSWPPPRDPQALPGIIPVLPAIDDPVVQVKLWHATDVEGTALDPEGKPVESALIQLRRLKPDGTMIDVLARATTDREGHWQFPRVPQLAGLELLVKHPDFRVLSIRQDLATPPTADLILSAFSRISFQRPGALTGRVTAAGEPVAGANVWLFPPLEVFAERELRQARLAVTDHDGKFTHGIRIEGEATLFVVAKGLAPRDEKLALKPDQPQHLDLPLDRGQGRSGRIMHSAKQGVPNVPILLIGPGTMPLSEYPVIATTDESGTFHWPNAPKRMLRFQALLPDGRQWHFQWDCTAEKPIEVRVPFQMSGCD